MKKLPSKGKKMLITLIAVFITLVVGGIAVFSAIYFSAKLNDESIVAEKATLKIVGADGNEIDAEALNRYVKYEDVSTEIINAFVALEDKRFFSHNGVDYYRLGGAMIKNLKYGYFKEGGSTITQQLAKNTQLNNEKTLTRKIKEMKLAHDIEKKYSKEDILEMYLNAIYYGNGVYGIDSACKKYFDKKPSEIGVAEGAILAGIVKNPSAYSPIKNKEKATERMRLVLKLLKDQGYISEEEYESAASYEYVQPKSEKISSYFTAALSEACAILNIDEKTLIKSGYTIKCFYDDKLQKNIENIANMPDFNIKTIGGNEALNSVTVCDNASGGIIACVSCEGINPLTFRRSPGSAIKPIAVYAPALERKIITEASVYTDEKIDFGGYSPSNYQDVYLGNIDVETAVKNSVNTVAVKIFSETGKEYCLEKTAETGITVDKNDGNLSFALGGMTYGTTSKELCEAYMCFPNGGEHVKAGVIQSIRNKNGSVLYEKSSVKKRVFSEENAYIMTDLLQKTAQNGTAKKLSTVPCEIAGKTGTVGGNAQNTDAWCVSFSKDYTMCVWYGGANNNDEENITVTGGGVPSLLSASVYKFLPVKNTCFNVPETVCEADIDVYAREQTGKIYLAHETTPIEYRKNYLFGENNFPKEKSPYFELSENEFIAEYDYSRGVRLNFTEQTPCSYRITRIDLTDGSEKIVYASENSGSIENLTRQSSISDLDVSVGRIYSYRLEIISSARVIGIKNATVIT